MACFVFISLSENGSILRLYNNVHPLDITMTNVWLHIVVPLWLQHTACSIMFFQVIKETLKGTILVFLASKSYSL